MLTSDPQSIIVYRTPLEYQLWNSGILFPLIVGMVLSVLAVILTDKLAHAVLPFRVYNRLGSGAVIVVAVATMGLTLWAML